MRLKKPLQGSRENLRPTKRRKRMKGSFSTSRMIAAQRGHVLLVVEGMIDLGRNFNLGHTSGRPTNVGE